MTLHQPLNEILRDEAIKETQKDSAIRGRKLNPTDFLREVGRKFIQIQLDNFPALCEIARVQNKLKQDELKATGYKGKYTDSYGWSEERSFKHDFEIPSELYLFMVNLVYTDFWSNDNEKVWRTFMKRILRGDDSMELLVWVKSIYGSNSQKELVTY